MILKINLIIFCFTVLTSNVLAKDVTKPELMLANIYHQGIDLTDYWVSEKYDGVRALWDGQQFISRGGNIYHAPVWFIKDFPEQHLDGELWIAHQSFEKLVSTVRDKVPDDEAWKQVKFMVFDMPEPPIVFNDRLRCMKRLLADYKIPWLRLVKQWKVESHKALLIQLETITEAGAEGLMLHRGKSFYRGKRSGDLLKVKPYEDAEAIVIKHILGKGKYHKVMGAMLVEMPNKLRFKIGSGFDDEERLNPPKIGETITYQFHGLTKNGIPKFASFLRVRTLEGAK